MTRSLLDGKSDAMLGDAVLWGAQPGPLWRQIRQILERRILAGELAPGDQLPTEAELAVEFGVNRHTVRRAINQLRERNLVRVEQGRGTFVRERTLGHKLTRRATLSETAKELGRRLERRPVGATVVKADRTIAAALRMTVGEPVLKVDTLRLLDETPFGIASNFFPLPRFAGIDRLIAKSGSVARAFESYGVSEIIHRQTRIGARAISRSDVPLLGLPRGSPVIVLFSVNVDGQGQPIQVGRSRYAPNWIEFVIDYDMLQPVFGRSG
jgi:GntR family phosphonate transport system transcriptional regulator